MKKYDLIVIGSGAGLDVAAFAADHGLKVAIVEDGPLGGTCLNRGCIPSKMLIHSADVAETIKNSAKFGIKSKIESIDFTSIVRRVNDEIGADSKNIEKSIRESGNPILYKSEGKFIGPKTLKVGGEEITGDKIIIAAGTRPTPFKLLDDQNIPYLDSTAALRLEKQPRHLVIIGGGYIAAELAHFFGGLDTKVTILVRENTMLNHEDREIAKWFTTEFMKKYDVRLKSEVEDITFEHHEYKIKLKNFDKAITADRLLVAIGRTSNTDRLQVSAAGVKMNERGYIEVNLRLETNIKGIYALGDAVGIAPFRHTANTQAELLIHNLFFDKQLKMDYSTIGHAVFSSPQIGGVGQTEEQLKATGTKYTVGRAELKNTAMGSALQENGLIKVLADESGKEILGVHIVGPEASILIHEAIIATQNKNSVSAIRDTVHIHPALNEWLQRALFGLFSF